MMPWLEVKKESSGKCYKYPPKWFHLQPLKNAPQATCKGQKINIKDQFYIHFYVKHSTAVFNS